MQLFDKCESPKSECIRNNKMRINLISALNFEKRSASAGKIRTIHLNANSKLKYDNKLNYLY